MSIIENDINDTLNDIGTKIAELSGTVFEVSNSNLNDVSCFLFNCIKNHADFCFDVTAPIDTFANSKMNDKLIDLLVECIDTIQPNEPAVNISIRLVRNRWKVIKQ